MTKTRRYSGTKCWVIGRKTVLAPSGHEYITEPFIVFATEAEAVEAANMVEVVSRERPVIVEAALYQGGNAERERTP